jgi:hypothetical protein
MISLDAIKTADKLAVPAVLAVAIFGAGWAVNGWRKDAQIAELKTERANTAATQAQGALDDLTAASKTINDAARRYGALQSDLGVKIDDLKKELQNEPPLPPDCRPGPGRVRMLNSAIDAANKAAAGQPVGRAVPADTQAGR